jgi:hypothetical protein
MAYASAASCTSGKQLHRPNRMRSPNAFYFLPPILPVEYHDKPVDFLFLHFTETSAPMSTSPFSLHSMNTAFGRRRNFNGILTLKEIGFRVSLIRKNRTINALNG